MGERFNNDCRMAKNIIEKYFNDMTLDETLKSLRIFTTILEDLKNSGIAEASNIILIAQSYAANVKEWKTKITVLERVIIFENDIKSTPFTLDYIFFNLMSKAKFLRVYCKEIIKSC